MCQHKCRLVPNHRHHLVITGSDWRLRSIPDYLPRKKERYLKVQCIAGSYLFHRDGAALLGMLAGNSKSSLMMRVVSLARTRFIRSRSLDVGSRWPMPPCVARRQEFEVAGPGAVWVQLEVSCWRAAISEPWKV